MKLRSGRFTTPVGPWEPPRKRSKKNHIEPEEPSGPCSLLILGIDVLRCVHEYLDRLSQYRMEKACDLPVMGIHPLPPPAIDLLQIKNSFIIEMDVLFDVKVRLPMPSNPLKGYILGRNCIPYQWKKTRERCGKKWIRTWVRTWDESSAVFTMEKSWFMRPHPLGWGPYTLHDHLLDIHRGGYYQERVHEIRFGARTPKTYYSGHWFPSLKLKRIWLKRTRTKSNLPRLRGLAALRDLLTSPASP